VSQVPPARLSGYGTKGLSLKSIAQVVVLGPPKLAVVVRVHVLLRRELDPLGCLLPPEGCLGDRETECGQGISTKALAGAGILSLGTGRRSVAKG
jgi:hypothetical protein